MDLKDMVAARKTSTVAKTAIGEANAKADATSATLAPKVSAKQLAIAGSVKVAIGATLIWLGLRK